MRLFISCIAVVLVLALAFFAHAQFFHGDAFNPYISSGTDSAGVAGECAGKALTFNGTSCISFNGTTGLTGINYNPSP